MSRSASAPPVLMDGLLLINKPAGMTSHDVVYKVRKKTGIARVGHTGTLDPFATGVLPICVGKATRLASLLTLEDKTYEATLKLGENTDTLDRDGQVMETQEVPADLTEARIETVLEPLRGEIMQRPPMYSAVKVGGKRLYEYARAGEEVERAARPVTIHSLELLSLAPPHLRFRVHCSKGTYVRVIAADIGASLGCGGHLEALVRTQTGRFTLGQCLSLEALEAHVAQGTLASVVIPMTQMLPELPTLELSERQLELVKHGNPIRRKNLGPGARGLKEEGTLLLTHRGELVAIAEWIVKEGASGPDPSPDASVIQPRAVLSDG